MLNVLTHSFPTRRSSGREGVGEEAGQAVEAVAGEVGEQEHRFRRIGWHGQWREFDAPAAPGRVVLDGVAAGTRVGRDGATALVPEAAFADGGVHGGRPRLFSCGAVAAGRTAGLRVEEQGVRTFSSRW